MTMKKLLLILLLLPTIGFCQTKINRSQIDESVFRPEAGGALSGPTPTVTFNVPYKQHTLDVDEDMVLTLNGSGNVENSRIDIIATGDGTHVLTFPEFTMRGDAYDVNSVNEIRLRYNSAGVIGEIINQSAMDVLETELDVAIVTNEVPTQLNLTFNEAVIATEDGWTLTASAAAATIEGVSGSGTASIVFTLSRAILHSETVTVSYAGSIDGITTDLAGFELDDIVDFPVTVPDPPAPVTDTWDIDVCASGCDFTTGAAAHTAAVDGDVIAFETGTYRETITVTKNNLTFKAKAGHTPVISGFEIVGTSGWTVHSGNIYKKTITLPVNGFNTSSTSLNYLPTNTTLLANQLIRNDEMMPYARYPNLLSLDFEDMNTWESFKQYDDADGFKYNQLNDTAIPTTPPALVGATIISNGWYDSHTETINAHDNSGPGGTERVTFDDIRGPTGNGVWARQAYIITNDLGLLDAAGEWHYESGTLYFWQPGGGTPTGTIEHKARNWGFDLRGRSGTTIIGLTFTGVDPVITDASSTNTLIQGTTATYNNHHVRHDIAGWNGVSFGMAKAVGSKLLGSNSVFKDNVWSKSSSIMLWMGPNCLVENNLIHDSGYAGNSCGAFAPWAQDGGQRIIHNTVYNQGRGAVYFGYIQAGVHSNMEIAYNNFYNYGLINSDGGASYAGNRTVTTNLNYHHNWIHDHLSRSTPGFGGSNTGIYFDQASGGTGGRIHHNVVWGNMTGDIYHQLNYNGTGAIMSIYNNTFATSLATTYGGNEYSYKTPDTSPLDVQRNNIYVRRILVNWITGNWGNNANYIIQKAPPHGTGTDPLFVGSGGSGLNYRIQTGSPAKDAGQVIAGDTDPVVGSAPDIGAYEFGASNDWVPGYTVPASDGTVDDDEWGYSLNWTEDNTALQIMTNQDVHYTLTTGSTATSPQFTNSKVDFYYESCIPHGIARFEVLNNSAVVIATADVDTSSGVACSVGTRETHSFTGLAAGTKTARITLLSGASIVFDGGKFFD